MKFFISDEWRFVAVSAVFLGLYYFFARRSGITPVLKALRYSAVLIACFLILRPYLVKQEKIPVKPNLAALLDLSAHMRGPAKEGAGKPKYESAVRWILKNQIEIEKNFSPGYYGYADKAHRLELSSSALPVISNYESSLQDSIKQVLSENAAAINNIWVITDGLSLSEADLSLSEELKGVKVDFIGVGDEVFKKILRIKDVKVPGFAFVHIPFGVSVLTEARGYGSRKITISVRDENNAVLAEESRIAPGDFQTLESTFTLKVDGVGTKRYKACVSDASDRSCRHFKRANVEAIREKTRVMYLCGRPSFEYAALREFLKTNRNIELVSFVILRNPEDAVGVTDSELSLIPFPANEIFFQDISHFDLFILHNFSFNRFGMQDKYAASLREFVKKGGSLLVIGGQDAFGSGNYAGFEAFREMLPVELANAGDYSEEIFEVQPLEHPFTKISGSWKDSLGLWNMIQALKGLNLFEKAKPDAETILKYKTQDKTGPLAVLKKFGKGRVMAMASPSTWRWKMQEGRVWKLSGFYQSFWSRAISGMTGSLELEKIKLSVIEGTSNLARMRVLDENYNPVKEDNLKIYAHLKYSGNYHPLVFRLKEPGIYETEIYPVFYGKQSIRAVVKTGEKILGEDEISFEAASPMSEFIPPDSAGLKALALKTNGKYYNLKNAGIRELSENAVPAYSERIVYRFELWNREFMFFLIFILFCAEWVIRRLSGYI
ncbi:MAG: hypothetical protein HY746_10105 [Elusimicrobia bacterium]|nr:hypothetical protein [Elusimicrobiota bacterium]